MQPLRIRPNPSFSKNHGSCRISPQLEASPSDAGAIQHKPRGDSDPTPKQSVRFLENRTADENAAIKEIANRIVTEKLAGESAPSALDVMLTERCTLLTFSRRVETPYR